MGCCQDSYGSYGRIERTVDLSDRPGLVLVLLLTSWVTLGTSHP